MTVQRGIYLWSDLSLKKTDTIIEHLFIFLYIFIKEWILIQIFHVYDSCLADFPTYFNVFYFLPS